MNFCRVITFAGILAAAGCTASPPAAAMPADTPARTREFAAVADMIGLSIGQSRYSSADVAADVVPPSPWGEALVAAFPNRRPPLSCTIVTSLESGKRVDAATGQRVRVWSAKLKESDGNRATVEVSYSGGIMDGAGCVYELERDRGGWNVVRRTFDYVE
jgi:hypothetical protein